MMVGYSMRCGSPWLVVPSGTWTVKFIAVEVVFEEESCCRRLPRTIRGGSQFWSDLSWLCAKNRPLVGDGCTVASPTRFCIGTPTAYSGPAVFIYGA